MNTPVTKNGHNVSSADDEVSGSGFVAVNLK